jgi:hypothetical protein
MPHQAIATGELFGFFGHGRLSGNYTLPSTAILSSANIFRIQHSDFSKLKQAELNASVWKPIFMWRSECSRGYRASTLKPAAHAVPRW